MEVADDCTAVGWDPLRFPSGLAIALQILIRCNSKTTQCSAVAGWTRQPHFNNIGPACAALALWQAAQNTVH